jgi:hypothetical protein
MPLWRKLQLTTTHLSSTSPALLALSFVMTAVT